MRSYRVLAVAGIVMLLAAAPVLGGVDTPQSGQAVATHGNSAFLFNPFTLTTYMPPPQPAAPAVAKPKPVVTGPIVPQRPALRSPYRPPVF